MHLPPRQQHLLEEFLFIVHAEAQRRRGRRFITYDNPRQVLYPETMKRGGYVTYGTLYVIYPKIDLKINELRN